MLPKVRAVALGVWLMVSAAMPGSAAEPLDLKIGLWEMTTTAEMLLVRLPFEMVANLSREQRIKLGQKHQEGVGLFGLPQTESLKECVTSAYLRNMVTVPEYIVPNCAIEFVSNTQRFTEIHQNCNTFNKVISNIQLRATDQETFQGDFEILVGMNAVTEVSWATTKGRWLGPNCGDLEPRVK